jgi:micrococcal nuclease
VQCYGPEAKYWLGTSVAGSSVWIFADPSQDERDRYGRLLAYVWVYGGAIVNQVAVAKGYAREYTYKTPHAYQSQFRADQAKAKSQKWGLWAACPDADSWAAGDVDMSEPTNDSPASAALSGTVPSAQAIPGAPRSGAGTKLAPSPSPSTAIPSEVPATSNPATSTATADPGETVPGDCGPDQVFVHGYIRKDGNYVSAYCRKKPS